MIKGFFDRTAPIVGKFFRQVVLIIISLSLFFSVYLLISVYFEDLYSSESFLGFTFNFISGIWYIFIIAFLFLFGIAILMYLFDSDYKPTRDDYKNWGMVFYFLIPVIIVYLFLKSKGIDLLLLLYLLFNWS